MRKSILHTSKRFRAKKQKSPLPDRSACAALKSLYVSDPPSHAQTIRAKKTEILFFDPLRMRNTEISECPPPPREMGERIRDRDFSFFFSFCACPGLKLLRAHSKLPPRKRSRELSFKCGNFLQYPSKCKLGAESVALHN